MAKTARAIGLVAVAAACLAALLVAMAPRPDAGGGGRDELEARWGPPALMPRGMRTAKKETPVEAKRGRGGKGGGGGVTVNVRESHNGGSAAPVNVFVLPSLPSLSSFGAGKNANGGQGGGGLGIVKALEEFAEGKEVREAPEAASRASAGGAGRGGAASRTIRSSEGRGERGAAAAAAAGLQRGGYQLHHGRQPRRTISPASARERQMEEALRAREEERAREEMMEREEREEREREMEAEKERERKEEAEHDKEMEEREEKVMAVAQSLRRTELEQVAEKEKKKEEGEKGNMGAREKEKSEGIVASASSSSSESDDGMDDEEFLPMADLAKRAMLLRVQIGEMRDSVVTSAGVARLREAEAELKDLTSQLKAMPSLLPSKIEDIKRDIRKAKQQVGYLRQGVLAEDREVSWRRGAAEKERKVHKEEEAMQAKVELARAQQDVIADLSGDSEPKHEPLVGVTEESKVLKEYEEHKARDLRMKQRLESEQARVARLEKDEDELERDEAEVERAKALKGRKGREEMLAGGGDDGGGLEVADPKLDSGESLWDALTREQEISEEKAKEEGVLGLHKEKKEVKHPIRDWQDEREDEERKAHQATEFQRFLSEHSKEDRMMIKNLHTVDPNGYEAPPEQGGPAIEVKTPPEVKELQGGEGDEGDGSPKSVWCEWGGQMVPCAPGYGGAWVDPGRKHLTGGIWPLDDEKEEVEPKEAYTGDATHVKAGHRSHSYIQDMFDYGRGGVFGARRGEGGTFEGGARGARGRWEPMGGQLLAQESPEYIEKVMTPR